MAFLTTTFVAAGRALGGQEAALIAFGVALAAHAVSYRFGDQIVLRMYRVKEIDTDEAPRLYRIVQQLTFPEQMPMPKLFLIPRDSPHAFATGRDDEHAAVAVSVKMLQAPDETEIRSVLERELSRVKNRDRLVGAVASVLAGAIPVLAN
jgi:heat shock protein HtpX